MSDLEAVAAWCRFVRLVMGLDEEMVAVVSALVETTKASRGEVPVSKFPPVRKLGTGPLLDTGN